MSSSSLEIRPAAADDHELICRLLREQFPGTSVALWRSVLAYPWMPEAAKPDWGMVLADAKTIRGFSGAIFSDWRSGDRVDRHCNLFGWCVQPEYRRHSLALVRANLDRPRVTFTNLTSRTELLPLFKALGFSPIDVRKWLMPAQLVTLPLAFVRRRNSGVRILSAPEIESALPPDIRRIYDDHLGRQFRLTVFETPRGPCLLATKRTYHVGITRPYTEVHYVSDREAFRRHLDQMRLHLMMLDRTVGLSADERIIGFEPTDGQPAAVSGYFRSEDVPRDLVSTLYSEIALVP